MTMIMNKNKAAQLLAEKIITKFLLPYKLCYPFINLRIHEAIGVGVDIVYRACLEEMKILKCKPIIQYTKEGKVIRQWESIHAAEKALGISTGNITVVLNPNSEKRPLRLTAGGFKWEYVNKDDRVKQNIIKRKTK